MAVARSGELVQVVFRTTDSQYGTAAKRGQIVHEAFHAAMPPSLTVGHRLTFRSTDGFEIFADNFLGDLADRTADSSSLILETTAVPIPGHAGPWRNIGFDHLAITVGDRSGARDFFRDRLRRAL